MNRWNIPKWLEDEVIDRDKNCVYCGVKFNFISQSYKIKPSWEHIINDAKIISHQNIVRCCIPCNSSKGVKLLSDRFNNNFCKKKNININIVAKVVREALDSPTEKRIYWCLNSRSQK